MNPLTQEQALRVEQIKRQFYSDADQLLRLSLNLVFCQKLPATCLIFEQGLFRLLDAFAHYSDEQVLALGGDSDDFPHLKALKKSIEELKELL